MNDRRQPNQGRLVPSDNRELTTRSSALVRRGLETLLSLEPRIVRFLSDRSIGNLYVRAPSDPPYDAWEALCEAKGSVTVPTGKELLLDVSHEALADLSPLASLEPTDLQWLDLGEPQVSDTGLVILQRLNALRGLILWGTRVSNGGLMHLRELTTLQWLDLGMTQISDAGLVHLQKLTALQGLYLEDNQIQSVGLVYLQKLTNLWDLRLEGTQVDDLGLAHLCDLKVLQVLNLRLTQVSDLGLMHLQGLTALRSLNLVGT